MVMTTANIGTHQATCDIVRSVAARSFGLQISDLDSGLKSRRVVAARGVAMYCIRGMTPLSLPQIARMFGNMHHTTVLLVCRRVGSQIEAGRPAEIVAAVRDVFDALQPSPPDGRW